MKKIVLASNNTHKVEEIQAVLAGFQILTLKEVGIEDEVEETANTFEGNAFLKAKEVFDKVQIPTLSDDSGLEVESLNGRPGVFSKRYAGTGDSDDNMDKLLNELSNKENRNAHFRTVLCYYDGENEDYFEGIVEGKIIKEKKGSQGFGYDPIFVPDGYNKTFAELGSGIKNTISHRSKAIEKFKKALN